MVQLNKQQFFASLLPIFVLLMYPIATWSQHTRGGITSNTADTRADTVDSRHRDLGWLGALLSKNKGDGGGEQTERPTSSPTSRGERSKNRKGKSGKRNKKLADNTAAAEAEDAPVSEAAPESVDENEHGSPQVSDKDVSGNATVSGQENSTEVLLP
jgi:hypothetical protein